MEVVIYTNTGCSACHQAKEFLAQHNVSFVEKSIAKDPSLINELASMGFRAVPVIRSRRRNDAGIQRSEVAKNARSLEEADAES